jgi:hypothetical protein
MIVLLHVSYPGEATTGTEMPNVQKVARVKRARDKWVRRVSNSEYFEETAARWMGKKTDKDVDQMAVGINIRSGVG